MKKDLKIERDSGNVRVGLPEDIDHHSAKYMREEIDRAVGVMMPKRLILDFSGVKFMDSSGIALIIGRSELARSIGSRVRVTGLSSTQKRLVRLSGVERIEGIVIENTEVKK